MCCEYSDARPEDTVGECPDCYSDVDSDGDTTEECCAYSPSCDTCGYAPCDDSCQGESNLNLEDRGDVVASEKRPFTYRTI